MFSGLAPSRFLSQPVSMEPFIYYKCISCPLASTLLFSQILSHRSKCASHVRLSLRMLFPGEYAVLLLSLLLLSDPLLSQYAAVAAADDDDGGGGGSGGGENTTLTPPPPPTPPLVSLPSLPVKTVDRSPLLTSRPTLPPMLPPATPTPTTPLSPSRPSPPAASAPRTFPEAKEVAVSSKQVGLSRRRWVVVSMRRLYSRPCTCLVDL